MEELGPFATRLRLEETQRQMEQMREAMKVRAAATMLRCLNMQMQQQQKRHRQQKELQAQNLHVMPSREGKTSDVTTFSVSSKRSLDVWAPQSADTLATESKTWRTKPSERIAKLQELEKQVNSLEKQCKLHERHLREHDRDQKNMLTKLHHLEMRILQDGQKEMIWGLMNKIPTEHDIKIIESFHSFALDRLHTESQIRNLSSKSKALNSAMMKINEDPLQTGKDTEDAALDLPRSSDTSFRTWRLPDFTSMSYTEREAFFKKCGITLCEFDADSPEPDEASQQKQNWLNIFKSRKSEDQTAKGGKRRSRTADAETADLNRQSTLSLKSKHKQVKSSNTNDDVPKNIHHTPDEDLGNTKTDFPSSGVAKTVDEETLSDGSDNSSTSEVGVDQAKSREIKYGPAGSKDT